MTDSPFEKPLNQVPLAPAALKACNECPWRASINNELDTVDAKREDASFSRESMTRHWKRITTEGTTMRCHLTTPGYHRHDEKLEAEGFKKPQEFKGEGHRQCAGQLAVLRNELRKIEEYESHEAYLSANPRGLTQPVAARFQRVLEDPSTAPVGFRWPAADVEDVMEPAELVDTESLAWKFDRHGVVNMRNLMQTLFPSLGACDCHFCSQHEDIHESTPVTLKDGTTVRVDKGVAGVVAAFAAAGVNTSGSCEDFGPALRSVDMSSFLLLRDSPSGRINYSTALREGGAHVRFSKQEPAGRAIAAALARLNGVILEEDDNVAQVIYRRNMADIVEQTIRANYSKHPAKPAEQRMQNHDCQEGN